MQQFVSVFEVRDKTATVMLANPSKSFSLHLKEPFQSILCLSPRRSLLETINQAYSCKLVKQCIEKRSFRNEKSKVSCVAFVLKDVLHVSSMLFVNRRPIFDGSVRSLILPDHGKLMKREVLICFFGSPSRFVTFVPQNFESLKNQNH